MKKIILYLILTLILISFASAYTIKGNTVTYDSIYANMSVQPHTIKNPHLQWQHFTVTAKLEGDLCVAYVFNDTLINANIEYGKNLIDVKDQFNYIENNDNHIYYLDTPIHFNQYENKTWRIKYTPKYNSGKWNLWTWNSKSGDCRNDYQTLNYDFFYDLDPWWNTADSSITQGFIYLTNSSFEDTFNYYDYLLLNSADSVTGWSKSPPASMTTSTTRLEYDRSIQCDGTLSADWCAWVLQDVNITGYDTFAVWAYSNTTNTFEIELDFDDATFIIYTGTANSAWSKHNIDISSKQNRNITNVIFQPNIDNNNDVRLLIDHLHVYNSADYFNTTNWDIKTGNWELQSSVNNGFGFNTTSISTYHDSATVFNMNISSFNYNNFELISKLMIAQDKGSDFCSISLIDSDYTFMRTAILSNKIRATDDNNVGISLDTVSVNEPIYIKITANNSFVSHYYAKDLADINKNWTLIINYTTAKTPDTIKLSFRDSQCIIDNVLIRELPVNNQIIGTDYIRPSFIYDSSNGTIWNSTTCEWFYNGASIYSETMLNPEDRIYCYWNSSQATNTSYNLSVKVTVEDILGNEAYNMSQTLFINQGSLNLTIFNEETNKIITGENITINVWSESLDQTDYTTTGSYILSNVPTGYYFVSAGSDNYATRRKQIFINSSIFTDDRIYLIDKNISQEVIFYIFNNDEISQPNVTIEFYRTIDLVSTLLTSTLTDFSGSSVVSLNPYVVYTIILTPGDKIYNSRTVNLQPYFPEYNIYLLTNGTTFSTLTDHLTFLITPTASELNYTDINFTLSTKLLGSFINYWGFSTIIDGTPYLVNMTAPVTGGIALDQLNLSLHQNTSFTVTYFISSSEGYWEINRSYYVLSNATGNNTMAVILAEGKEIFGERFRIIIVSMIAIISFCIVYIITRRDASALIGIGVYAFFAYYQWFPTLLAVFISLMILIFVIMSKDW